MHTSSSPQTYFHDHKAHKANKNIVISD